MIVHEHRCQHAWYMLRLLGQIPLSAAECRQQSRQVLHIMCAVGGRSRTHEANT